MSLNWNFDEKIGEISIHQCFKGLEQDYSVNLYQGNAFLIGVYETDNEYTLNMFFADETHMKRCFGIDKKYSTFGENMYLDGIDRWQKVRISRKYKYLKKFVSALVEAFPEITIEIYND